jgi:hypothetical protein
MPLLSASADTFILGATICLIAFARRKPAPASAKDARQPMYRPIVTGILAVHTLYMIYLLSLRAPPNLFTRLHIPLSMPSQKIRATLLARTGRGEEDTLPEHIEELLMKLNTFDLRAYFVRFVPTFGLRVIPISLDQPGSARTQFRNVNGARPSQSMRRIRSPSLYSPTSRRPRSSEW